MPSFTIYLSDPLYARLNKAALKAGVTPQKKALAVLDKNLD
jgi:hypothetical protein